MSVEKAKIHRLFYPQVPLVLCTSFRGRVSAMPVVSYASISDSPALIAIACNPRTFTYRLCVRARAFTLCLLDSVRLPAMERLVEISGESVTDKLKEAGLQHGPGKTVTSPVITDSVAVLECTLHSKSMFGDHSLLIGYVEACHANNDFSDYWDFGKYRPILYTGWKKGLTTYKPSPPGRPKSRT